MGHTLKVAEGTSAAKTGRLYERLGRSGERLRQPKPVVYAWRLCQGWGTLGKARGAPLSGALRFACNRRLNFGASSVAQFQE